MSRVNLSLVLFAVFAFGLPIWAMQSNGESRGKQSSLMWGQAESLDDATIDNLAAYIQTL
ncbi:MAG: hypothetical protein KDI17_14860 [Halioglobus sp.]|nr:hypothetical protein [Halioglobus sp.]